MRHVDFLLVGGGLASATAAVTLRKEGAGGSIAIIAEEDVPPYNRPPLSKSVLLGTLDRQHSRC
jgi:NADPH-dependent 2,4-dienoyl-CoA reductase/sulfur reductase-like enzyme